MQGLHDHEDGAVVPGAGYVGLEQAQLFAHLGVPVTVVGRFAPHSEPEIAAVLPPATSRAHRSTSTSPTAPATPPPPAPSAT